MNRPRIGLFINDLDPGGAQTQSYYVVRALRTADGLAGQSGAGGGDQDVAENRRSAGCDFPVKCFSTKNT
jgi:hypothetical protein